MMGSGKRGVSICFTTLEAWASQVLDTQRDRLALRPHGNDLAHPFGRIPCAFISSGCGETLDRTGLLAETELGIVAPHTMQHDGELAGDSDACPRHASPFGDLHAPGPQGRPLAA